MATAADVRMALRKYLKDHGLTLRAAAARWGVSKSHLCRVRQGDRYPTREIAESLGFTVVSRGTGSRTSLAFYAEEELWG